jgi:hypothetical protein
VPERERLFDRREAADEQLVEVARRNGQRPHQRLAVSLEPRLVRLAPFELAGLHEGELLHGRPLVSLRLSYRATGS